MTDLEKRAARMKWDPPAPGTEARKEMPASAFLSPSTRTYPYKVLIDGQWVISEPGLRSAISVANFRRQPEISRRASQILEKLLKDDEMEQSELTHYGILGMRWGIRRPVGPDGLVSSTSRKSREKAGRLKEKAAEAEASSDYTRARQLQSKAAKSLSNAEMKSLTERLQLEQNLARLNPSWLKRGENYSKTALAAGTSLASAYALYKSPAGQALKSVIEKALRTASS